MFSYRSNMKLIPDGVANFLNIYFLVVFVIEASFKILCMGKDYFKDGWNVFDFIIVLISIGIAFYESIFGMSANLS